MKNKLATYIILVLPFLIFSQEEGKVISGYGKTYKVVNPEYKTDTKHDLKVVFDIGRTFADSSKVNPLINTAARFLNMHEKAGVSVEKLKVAMVLHGGASYDILNDAKYKAKYGIINPNTKLIAALSEKGVQIILCGQTAAYRKITKEDVLPEIKFALSAMTALVQLQNENYRLINF
ncbi:DsrE family protein [Aquimarina sp. 2304DJ70-9]|uniref:DsrE family protein n=1 Tax=Aquimarina penaris TaxID=3231044 RepID=UPI0034635B13